MRCYQRLLNILSKDHVTNEEVCEKIEEATEEYDELWTLLKKRKQGICKSERTEIENKRVNEGQSTPPPPRS